MLIATHRSDVRYLPLRSPTLPPATHTNLWVLGNQRLTVVDPSPTTEAEKHKMLEVLAMQPGEVQRIVLTHHHHDHYLAATWLRDRLTGGVPVVAHHQTAAQLPNIVDVTVGHLHPLQVDGNVWSCLHTPGHAPGHLVLHHTDTVIAGDLVAGEGTILIDPRDGNLAHYLSSLTSVRDLKSTWLMPAHGDPLQPASLVLDAYISHRHGRTDQIRTALFNLGYATPLQIAEVVYCNLEQRFHALAAIQIVSHLIWLEEHGIVRRQGDGWVSSQTVLE